MLPRYHVENIFFFIFWQCHPQVELLNPLASPATAIPAQQNLLTKSSSTILSLATQFYNFSMISSTSSPRMESVQQCLNLKRIMSIGWILTMTTACPGLINFVITWRRHKEYSIACIFWKIFIRTLLSFWVGIWMWMERYLRIRFWQSIGQVCKWSHYKRCWCESGQSCDHQGLYLQTIPVNLI